MIHLLRSFDYEPPSLREYQVGDIKVQKHQDSFVLYVHDHQWNAYNTRFHDEAFQVFPHYFLAAGHCVCTGLGFGVRERWLLKKKEVTRVSVIEKNQAVIDYHRWLGHPWLDQIDIINHDADDYRGDCDTLLLDHYEQETDDGWLDSVRKVSVNIKHKTLWPWSIEPLLEQDAKRKNQSIWCSYQDMRRLHDINLPDIEEETLMMLMFMFFGRHSFMSRLNLSWPQVIYD